MIISWCLGDFFLFYSPHNSKGPKKKHHDAVQRHVDTNGYMCGDLVQFYKNGEMSTAITYGNDGEEDPMLSCKEYHKCGASVEAKYSVPEGDIERGRRIITNHVC